MSIRKIVTSGVVGAAFVLGAVPAHAGIPVFDGTAIAQQIQQVIAWSQQYQQMVETIQKYQQQIVQMQTMTSKLDGLRNLGTILNDPAINASLPTEMRNIATVLANPSALTSNPAAINSILASFGVTATANPDAGKGNADALGKVQSIMSAAQQRVAQLQQLATRVDGSTDAKTSLDLLNRNTIEVASINNQLMQTMASIEASRQSEELRQLAKSQAFSSGLQTGGARPVRTLTY